MSRIMCTLLVLLFVAGAARAAHASYLFPLSLMEGTERGLCSSIVMLLRALPGVPNKEGTAAQLRSLLAQARARPEASRDRIAHCVGDGVTCLGAAVRTLLISQKTPKLKVPGGYDTLRALVLLSRWIQPGTKGCFNFFCNELTLGGGSEPLETSTLAEKLCQP